MNLKKYTFFFVFFMFLCLSIQSPLLVMRRNQFYSINAGTLTTRKSSYLNHFTQHNKFSPFISDGDVRLGTIQVSSYIHGEGTVDLSLELMYFYPTYLPTIFRDMPSYITGVLLKYRSTKKFFDPSVGILWYNDSLILQIAFPESHELDILSYETDILYFLGTNFGFSLNSNTNTTTRRGDMIITIKGDVSKNEKTNQFFRNIAENIFGGSENNQSIYSQVLNLNTSYTYVELAVGAGNTLLIKKRIPRYFDITQKKFYFTLAGIVGFNHSETPTFEHALNNIFEVIIFAKNITVFNSTLKRESTWQGSALTKVTFVKKSETNNETLPCPIVNFSANLGHYPELKVWKDSNYIGLNPGREITINIYCINSGYGPAHNVTINDALPSEFSVTDGNLSATVKEVPASPFDLANEPLIIHSYNVTADTPGTYEFPDGSVTFHDNTSNRYETTLKGGIIIFVEQPHDSFNFMVQIFMFFLFFGTLVAIDLYLTLKKRKRWKNKKRVRR